MLGFVESLLAPPRATTPAATHDFWYSEIGASTPTASGMRASVEDSMRVGAFWAAVNLRAKIVASVPLHLYRRRGKDRDLATDHSLYPLLHDRPNALQTSMQFRRHKETCRILRGNSFAYKVQDDAGELLGLLPLDPAAVTPEKVKVRTFPNGLPEYSLRYRVRTNDGHGEIVLLPDEVHHTIGFSFDGLIGVSVVQYAARQTVGTSLAIQEYGGRFFGNGARPGGILAPKSNLSKDDMERLVALWNQDTRGPWNAHKIKALPVDVTYTAIGLSNEDSQFLETQEHLVRECARLLEIPPHMIGETTKETSWGTGIEQMSIGFLVYHVAPWLEDDEQALKRDLIPEADLFAEHDVDGLLRGDAKSQAEALQIARQNGVINAAYWARKKNWPIPEGEAGEAYWRPANMVDANAPPMPAPSSTEDAHDEPERAQVAHYLRLLNETAERVIRRETAELARHAQRAAADPDGWRSAVTTFYEEHVGYVAQALQIPRTRAQPYCDAQAADAIRRGAAALDDWKTTRAADLIGLARQQGVTA